MVENSLTGHENWIRSLAFKKLPNSKDLMLASASQDRYIRLWRIHEGSVESIGQRTAEIDPENDVSTDLLSNKVYHICDRKFVVTFEALLMGHDDWVFSIAWHPEKLQLLSASADTTLMFWAPDQSSGIWICSSRLGDVSIKGASTATGASGGFWVALWLNNGNEVITVGKTGSWRLWRLQNDEWVAQTGISGHVREVTDLSWEDNGSYLLSTSLDQTTRLFGVWKKDSLWHEMSRPQIHGYDMITVKSMTPEIFVSAGDEKTLRVFEEPKGIAYLLENICGTTGTHIETLPESAIVPALGLSNKQEEVNESKQVGEIQDEEEDELPAESILSVLTSLNEPPREDHLQRQTLWPELEKLYGHGYEISAIDISQDKKVLATCCKANNETHAVVRLYDTQTWLQLKPTLAIHSLTITRLRFSPDDKYLLSVSRDRQWAVWERTDEPLSYRLHASNPKGHNRIIWDCCWLSDGGAFITASRDKSIKLWQLSEEAVWKDVAQVKFDSPVTAVDVNDENKLVVGLETGELFVYQVKGTDIVLQVKVDETFAPDQRITRITWRPSRMQFAVSSEDFSLRIFNVQ